MSHVLNRLRGVESDNGRIPFRDRRKSTDCEASLIIVRGLIVLLVCLVVGAIALLFYKESSAAVPNELWMLASAAIGVLGGHLNKENRQQGNVVSTANVEQVTVEPPGVVNDASATDVPKQPDIPSSPGDISGR